MELYNDETVYSSSESGDVVLWFVYDSFSLSLFLLLRAVLTNYFDVVQWGGKNR